MSARNPFKLLRELATGTHRTQFINEANAYLVSNGWLRLLMNKEEGDKHASLAQEFLKKTHEMYSTPEGPLARAASRPELVDMLARQHVGIDKANPQIGGQYDHLNVAEHLITNDSANLFSTAHSSPGKHAFFYASQYARFHGLKASFVIPMAHPLLFLTPSVVAKLNPAPFERFDEQEGHKAIDEGRRVPQSIFEDAKKPEITVITSLPGRPDIDLRPSLDDVMGVMSINTARKIASSLFFTECPMRGVQAAMTNPGFAPQSFSLEVVGLLCGNPEVLEVATENAHQLKLLDRTQRPMFAEEVLDALVILEKEFPRLERAGLSVPARTQIFSAVPVGAKTPAQITEFLVEEHKAHYQAEKLKVEMAMDLAHTDSGPTPPPQTDPSDLSNPFNGF